MRNCKESLLLQPQRAADRYRTEVDEDRRNHPGRQSPLGAVNRSFFAKTIAPSAIPLNLGDNWLASLARIILFGTPQEMTLARIDDVIAQFTRAARLALRAGFHGVEVHAGRMASSNVVGHAANPPIDGFLPLH